MTSVFRSDATQYERMFIVGDIHGCSAELEILLNALHRQAQLSSRDLLLFIGDYIDRGPDSRGVIDLVLDAGPATTCYLRGNHEDMFLDYLGFEGRFGKSWLRNGGVETLASYGCTEGIDSDRLLSEIPERHLRFFQRLESGVLIEKYCFVHAGIHPLRSLDSQRTRDLFWIREEFVMNSHRLPCTVVFGHTPFEEVMVNLPFKIGIDTGCVYGNKLTCLELRSGELFQVRVGGKEVLRSTISLVDPAPL